MIFKRSILAFIVFSPILSIGEVRGGLFDRIDGKAEVVGGPEAIELPSWLLQSSFQVEQRIETYFDGSEEAQGLVHRSETRESLVFQNDEHWRLRRVLPFSGSSREILRRPEGFYNLTSSQRKIPSPETYPPKIWQSLIVFPFELAQRWGFSTDERTWAEWFERAQSNAGEWSNVDGDQMRVSYQAEGEERQLRISFDGRLSFPPTLKMRVRGEWQIELGKEISDKMLQTALNGGSN